MKHGIKPGKYDQSIYRKKSQTIENVFAGA